MSATCDWTLTLWTKIWNWYWLRNQWSEILTATHERVLTFFPKNKGLVLTPWPVANNISHKLWRVLTFERSSPSSMAWSSTPYAFQGYTIGGVVRSLTLITLYFVWWFSVSKYYFRKLEIVSANCVQWPEIVSANCVQRPEIVSANCVWWPEIVSRGQNYQHRP